MKALFVALTLLCLFVAPALASDTLEKLKAAPGYQVEIYADHLPGARSMALGAKGSVFVGTRAGEVYAIRDHHFYTIAKGLNEPNGVAFRNGALYVAEISRILKFKNIETHLDQPPKPEVIYAGLPTEKHHGWKFIAFGPDGFLYVPVGAPCNICNPEEKDQRFAAILRFKKLDGSAPEIFAKGIRNTVGFDWNPKTHELWFTDNGRDQLGEDIPADELNRAPKAGLHFGFPYCHQGDLLDPEFGKGKKCSNYTPPVFKFGAHVAALGMRFLSANTILVAEHGSWNRSKKVGYQVLKLTLSGNRVTRSEPFLSGFLQPGEQVLGRPVDVQPMKDGSVMVSDDQGDTIYRMVPVKTATR